MATLDIYINDGFLPMVDGAIVYHRGFGDRPTSASDPAPSLAPAYPDPANPGQYLVRRGYWASYFPQRTLIAEAGSVISLRVHNTLAKEHELRFLGAGPGAPMHCHAEPSQVAMGGMYPGGLVGDWVLAAPVNVPPPPAVPPGKKPRVNRPRSSAKGKTP